MSIATEVLSLRRDQSSSVRVLQAAIEWQQAAKDDRMLMRGHAVAQAADQVLLNVAVHAAEALRLFDEGGYMLTPPRRAVRPRKRIGGARRDVRTTRQLNFATFWS
jgi:hypothetical protein